MSRVRRKRLLQCTVVQGCIDAFYVVRLTATGLQASHRLSACEDDNFPSPQEREARAAEQKKAAGQEDPFAAPPPPPRHEVRGWHFKQCMARLCDELGVSSLPFARLQLMKIRGPQDSQTKCHTRAGSASRAFPRWRRVKCHCSATRASGSFGWTRATMGARLGVDMDKGRGQTPCSRALEIG
jgi:hypothetical protein